MKVVQPYSIYHGIHGFEVCQYYTHVRLVIRPLSKGAKAPLHRLHFAEVGGVSTASIDGLAGEENMRAVNNESTIRSGKSSAAQTEHFACVVLGMRQVE